MHLYDQGDELGFWCIGLGIISIVSWLIPPVAASTGALGIMAGFNGLDSQNRNLCQAGLILNIIGFIMACLKSSLVFIMA